MTDLLGVASPLPILSLWEPWASLIVVGLKRHETRHWPAPQSVVGKRIAIHAAKARAGFADAPHRLCDFAFGAGWERSRPLGCVVAVATLSSIHRTSGLAPTLNQSDLMSGNYDVGRFAYRLDDVRPLREALPLIGRQGFFQWVPPVDLEARLLPAVDHQAAAARWLEAA